MKTWNIESLTGYKPLTTFYEDFSIAEYFGKDAIKDTLLSALDYAKTDYRVLTELVMVLNWKIWEHYESNEPLGKIYNALWEKLDRYAINTLKGEELEYFFRTTD